MKDRVILYMAGLSAATITGLGVMLHQAMNVEATTRNDVNTATTQFTCSSLRISRTRATSRVVAGMECVPASLCVPSDEPEVEQEEL